MTARGDGRQTLRALRQSVANAVDHRAPFIRRFLAEDPQRGIPGAVLPVPQPTPAADEAGQQPSLLTHGSRQVGHRRVDGDYQVEPGNDGSGVGEVPGLPHAVHDREVAGRLRWFLQAVELNPRQLGQRGEGVQRDGTNAVMDEDGAAAPNQPDLQPRRRRQGPAFDQLRRRVDVGRAGGDRVEGCPEGPGEAEQRAEDVIGGRRRVGPDHLVDIRQALQQPNQHRLHHQDHPGAPRLRHFGVAQELDRVAETLLAMD